MAKAIFICVLMVAFLAYATGCASIFYPSRCGQKVHGPVDVGMLVVDILLTGLIGIVVDLITGAIYLPASYCVPSVDFGADFDPADGFTRLDSITLPVAGTAEFRLPVRATSGTAHEVSLLVLTEGGKTVACTNAAFIGTSNWQHVGSRLDISAGSATSGLMRVLIDGKQQVELPVKFLHPAQ